MMFFGALISIIKHSIAKFLFILYIVIVIYYILLISYTVLTVVALKLYLVV